MPEDLIGYSQLLERSLLGMVRAVLARAATDGLPGAHHFYLTFRTTEEGVEMPGALRARFPEEMTIILQHQFWDLEVGEDLFAVTLSFDRVRQRLIVPFEALTSFVDPVAGFGLRFGVAAEPAAGEAAGSRDEEGKVVSFDSFRRGKTP